MKRILSLLAVALCAACIVHAETKRVFLTTTVATSTNGVWRLYPETNATLNTALVTGYSLKAQGATMPLVFHLGASAATNVASIFEFRAVIGNLQSTSNNATCNRLLIPVIPIGTGPTIFITNVPAATVAGAETWRLVGCSNTSASTIYVSNILVNLP